MSVAIVIQDPTEAVPLVGWGALLAQPRDGEVVLYHIAGRGEGGVQQVLLEDVPHGDVPPDDAARDPGGGSDPESMTEAVQTAVAGLGEDAPTVILKRVTARDPASWLKFVTFCLTGALGLWALVRARLRFEERVLFGGGLLLFQVPYLLTHVSERYRFPVDPLLMFLMMILLLPLIGPRNETSA